MEQKDQPNIPEVFLKPYSAKDIEDKLYALWEESGFFNPDVCIEKGITEADAETFSIVLPPPNVTGILHIGHAYEDSLQDAFVRFHRMRGKKTLWIPGTDSAAMATQARVESTIYKNEKKTRHDLGREELLVRVEAFAEESKGNIIAQVKKMGSSLDWSRYAFTLDEKRYKAVMTAFVNMYEKGLIYRGARIVNWDPNLQTTVSDDEIEHIEKTDSFYYLKYGPFTIGTARPETKFGDKCVVMHPDDVRYKEYEHGQKIELEWINGPIIATIIKDEAIDMEFGSGVMTITPWHDTTDFEIAERHKIDKEQIIDERGLLLPIAGEFAGQHIKKARAAIVEKLQSKGLVEKIDEKYTHNVATNSRGSGIIEPQIKEQWFIDVNKEFVLEHSEIPGVITDATMTLKSLMKIAVESDAVQIPQERFKKIYFHWINNLHDWCISRQIWYGHRIPVWYRSTDAHGKPTVVHGKSNGTSSESRGVETYCGVEAPQGDGWQQDPDVLDTWFSSALWTFSTLGWPEETNDLKVYHPTSLMSPAYEILPLWVSRMILMSTFHLGQVPFRTVMIHGLVRDKQGRKFSKSLNNGIDPLDMIEKYGADALRMGLLVGTAIGNDISFDEDKVRGYKHFANKLWNITRFVLTNTAEMDISIEQTRRERDFEILAELHAKVAEVSEDVEKFSLYLAAEKAYHYVWHEFADKIIEESKPTLSGEDAGAKAARQAVLIECLIVSLKMLHPFMPFVTEAIWQELPKEIKQNEQDILMVAKWPL